MSLGKLPGIKGLVSAGSQERRRFKSDLSVDMISPPLGDFRHTMHVGRGGDVFGDTSFLSNYGGVKEPGSPDSANSSKSTGFFTRTFRHIRKNSGPRGEPRNSSSPPPDISPIIKNAVSLPQLNIDSPNGRLPRLPNSISATDSAICTYGIQSGFVTLPRFSRLDRPFLDGEHRVSMRERNGKPVTRSDSLTSFTLDLGPSLMSEVLGLFDNPSYLQEVSKVVAAEEEEKNDEEDDRSLTETFVSSTNSSVRGGSSRRIVNSKENSCSSSWTEEDRRSVASSSKSPPRSPPIKEAVMESEQFQRAADVLSRHYGGGPVTRLSPPLSKTPYAFSEEEEEIKV
ncbi:cdc42 effector protein 1b [Syngnathus scovelli]|uniref:cdc42 effector protein 1b n=1 Tax=Syngnathus scovelli TaxID=161590 RepID=UPI002110D522|nr:cdc42 effector protein 1b [Syngnathus scovelli]